MMSGVAPAFAIPESGDKDTRATMPAADAANGFFYIVREPWAHIVLQELCDFGPGAEYRDIVDALSGAHAYLSGRRTETDFESAQGSRSMRNLRR
jgi:predicted phage terminase large subunit-like protein